MSLLTAEEVAQILRVSKARVYELARRGAVPTVKIGERQLRRKEMYAMSASNSEAFLTALEGDRYSSLFALALCTGMRPAEYLGLRWTDVDLSKATVIVRRALVWRTKGGGW